MSDNNFNFIITRNESNLKGMFKDHFYGREIVSLIEQIKEFNSLFKIISINVNDSNVENKSKNNPLGLDTPFINDNLSVFDRVMNFINTNHKDIFTLQSLIPLNLDYLRSKTSVNTNITLNVGSLVFEINKDTNFAIRNKKDNHKNSKYFFIEDDGVQIGSQIDAVALKKFKEIMCIANSYIKTVYLNIKKDEALNINDLLSDGMLSNLEKNNLNKKIPNKKNKTKNNNLKI